MIPSKFETWFEVSQVKKKKKNKQKRANKVISVFDKKKLYTYKQRLQPRLSQITAITS